MDIFSASLFRCFAFSASKMFIRWIENAASSGRRRPMATIHPSDERDSDLETKQQSPSIMPSLSCSLRLKRCRTNATSIFPTDDPPLTLTSGNRSEASECLHSPPARSNKSYVIHCPASIVCSYVS